MLSKLQAINQILTAVGETVSLSIVEGAGDTANAEAILDASTLRVLSRGWYENTDESVLLTPDAAGQIAVPLNAIRISEVSGSQYDLIQRNGYLYDKAASSAVFTEPVTVQIVRVFPFESLSYPLQQMIVADATLRYQRGYVGSPVLDGFAREELGLAVADLDDAEKDSDNYNALDNPDVMGGLIRNNYRSPKAGGHPLVNLPRSRRSRVGHGVRSCLLPSPVLSL